MGSRSSNEDPLGEHLPLIDCPQCRIPVVKLRSKRVDTFNRVFYKCPNNFQNDDTCGYFWWHSDYVNLLRVKQQKKSFFGGEQEWTEGKLQRFSQELRVLATGGPPSGASLFFLFDASFFCGVLLLVCAGPSGGAAAEVEPSLSSYPGTSSFLLQS
ncbi:hypothetical protein GUJ93_ZPchr0007g5877 [Zizania palustris]|uniref:GRF-type domain-containing protein n=1 Tax=Zizania palustris TaxID=103762 RepID=A0A8J5T4L9_ZIZPA|nr:hypothetical protein GUJ93_ZPchr0007g5877 [Zizania palustris]